MMLAMLDGSAAHDPQRYRGRKVPDGDGVGAPLRWLSSDAAKAWRELAKMPWLNESDRAVTAMAALLVARLRLTEFDPAAANLLRLCLGSLGALWSAIAS